MCKANVLKSFLIVFAAAAFIGGTIANVEAGNPLGVYCWDLIYPDGTVEEIELAINLDAPPGFNHMSAVGVWHRIHGEQGEPTSVDMCVPVHGTAQLDRQFPEQYEIALSYEDIIQNPPVQGHFHALVDIFKLVGPFAYNDEPVPGLIVSGLMMQPRPCPIKCPPPKDLPDLTATLVNPPTTVSCPGGQGTCMHTVQFEISNIGTEDVVNDFEYTVELDSGLTLTKTIMGLPAGAVLPIIETLGPGDNCYNPDCQVSVEVDPGNIIVESDETNNKDTRLDIG